MRFSKSNLRRYHKQFKMAATARYFVTKEEYLYFHSYMADYFLGTYGGGVCKPFRYTEVISHEKIGAKSQICLKVQRTENHKYVKRCKSTCSD